MGGHAVGMQEVRDMRDLEVEVEVEEEQQQQQPGEGNITATTTTTTTTTATTATATSTGYKLKTFVDDDEIHAQMQQGRCNNDDGKCVWQLIYGGVV